MPTAIGFVFTYLFVCSHIRKKESSPEHFLIEEEDSLVKNEVSTNGRLIGPPQYSQHELNALSPKSPDDEFYDDQQAETLERRYSIRILFSFSFIDP